jgi:3-methyl-2-oxobutanoate hydroxymethyltransferase
VLVIHDVLGLYDRFTPKFAKRYADLGEAEAAAIAAYRDDVVAGRFPTREHSYAIPEVEWDAFVASQGSRLKGPAEGKGR